jgi:hypothetical protein
MMEEFHRKATSIENELDKKISIYSKINLKNEGNFIYLKKKPQKY